MVATKELMEMLVEAIHFKASINTMDATQHSLLSSAKRNPFTYNQRHKRKPQPNVPVSLSPVPPLAHGVVRQGKKYRTLSISLRT